MRLFLLISLVTVLAACTEPQAKEDMQALGDQLGEDAGYVAGQTQANLQQVGANIEDKLGHVADNLRNQVKRTNRKVRDWWLTPLPEDRKRVVPPSYCYNAMQDVLCYRQPMPGWEHRLVGYQGTHAAPPAAAMMVPLPMTTVDGREELKKRIDEAKPVFETLPVDEKIPDQAEDSVEVDSSREVLPDPTLAPQL